MVLGLYGVLLNTICLKIDKLKIDNTTNPVRTKIEKILIFDNRKSIKSNMNEWIRTLYLNTDSILKE